VCTHIKTRHALITLQILLTDPYSYDLLGRGITLIRRRKTSLSEDQASYGSDISVM